MDHTTMSSVIWQPRSLRNYRLASILLVRLDWGSIRQPPRTSMCLNIWRRMVSVWVWTSTHLKLQHGSLRNLTRARRLSGHCQNQQLCFLTVVCTIVGSVRVTAIYLLWIWRERHGGKFLNGCVVFHAPSTKLQVTCVNVLLVVTICPSFQSGPLKTMVLIINGH